LGRGRVVCCPRSAFATKTQASKDGETLRRNGESSEAPHVHQKRMAKTTAMVEEDLRRELHAVREELSQLKRALEELQNLQQPQKSAKSPYQWLQMFYPKRLLDSFKAQASPQLEKNFNWLVKVQLAKDRSKTKATLPEVPAPPKYPVVLAHGLGGDKPFLKCFMGIPQDLKSLGVSVFTPKVARYGGVYDRAEALKKQIMTVLEETKAPKVNIIGHSMGGLDARHFISNLGGHEVTASLITLGTPHHGSAYGQWIVNKTEAIGLEQFFKAKILPFPMEGHHNVTPKFMKEKFNPETPNHPDVAYFSIGGSKKIAPSHPLYFCQRILTKFEGPENDGLVSVASSKWGEYIDTLDIDHAAMINWSRTYDARVLYRRLMNILHDKGF
jgi:triacylglycerol lipase